MESNYVDESTKLNILLQLPPTEICRKLLRNLLKSHSSTSRTLQRRFQCKLLWLGNTFSNKINNISQLNWERIFAPQIMSVVFSFSGSYSDILLLSWLMSSYIIQLFSSQFLFCLFLAKQSKANNNANVTVDGIVRKKSTLLKCFYSFTYIERCSLNCLFLSCPTKRLFFLLFFHTKICLSLFRTSVR